MSGKGVSPSDRILLKLEEKKKKKEEQEKTHFFLTAKKTQTLLSSSGDFGKDFGQGGDERERGKEPGLARSISFNVYNSLSLSVELSFISLRSPISLWPLCLSVCLFLSLSI